MYCFIRIKGRTDISVQEESLSCPNVRGEYQVRTPITSTGDFRCLLRDRGHKKAKYIEVPRSKLQGIFDPQGSNNLF
jgi:hypothetical protein